MGRVPRLAAAIGLGILITVLPAHAANDPGAPRQWHMRLIGAETAWATGTGKGITVAVVDTGAHLTHEDLAPRIVAGWNVVEDNATPQDDNGHGTHVAGLIGAVANNAKGVIGVAPDVRIMPVKVLGSDGRGTRQDIGTGIRWAADHGAAVINISLGASLRAERISTPIPMPELIAAVRYAWGKGAICVLASGNDSSLASAFATEPGIVVTATNPDDRLAPYANNVGAARWGMAAPGGAGGEPDEDDVLSTFWTSSTPSAYAWAYGTSMSAPHVSGAAAVLRGLGLSAQQTVDRLRATAKDLGDPGEDDIYGSGRLDVAKAVAGLQPTGGGSTTTTAAGGTTTTTARNSTATTSRSGGGGLKVVTPTSEGARIGTSGSATTSTATPSPTLPGDEVVPEADDEEAAPPPSTSDEGDGGSVWPAGLLALLALGAAGAGLRRARRV